MSDNFKEITEWEVLTPEGWSNFSGVSKIVKDSYLKIEFSDGNYIECSENHKLKLKSGKFVYAKDIDINIDNELLGKDDIKVVSNIKKIDEKVDLYDLNNVEKNLEFYANDVVSHNCAFIDGVEEIWLSAQYTLSTGGKAIILSTPNGVGNFFHKMWIASESGEQKFNTIRLPWHLHPERDQEWRDKQTKLSGEKGAAQECDCLWGESRIKIKDIYTNDVEYITLEQLYMRLEKSNDNKKQ